MWLQAMREAKTGVYCGPLRLLAMEVFDSVNQQVASSSYPQWHAAFILYDGAPCTSQDLTCRLDCIHRACVLSISASKMQFQFTEPSC